MEYKLLEKEDLELMKEIIEDDDIEFDLEKINEPKLFTEQYLN